MPNLSDIARAIGVEFDAAADRPLRRVATLDDAGPDDVSYVTSDRYVEKFKLSTAAVIVAPAKLELPTTNATVLRVPDAELAIGRILEIFAPPPARPAIGTAANATIDPTATLGENASVGANVVVGRRVTIGRNVVLHPNVVIGDDCTVGDDCEFYPGVVLRERVSVGHRVILHANATIGSDGFGYRWDGKQHRKIPQIGTVRLEDDVEVGSNACVDRAKFGVTVVGRGSKIDNLCQIAHNVQIGQHCILCAFAGMAGSSTLGKGVVLGGASAIADHVHVADGVMLAAQGGLVGVTQPGQLLGGSPAIAHRDWLRERVNVSRLSEMFKTIKRLEAEVEQLKAGRAPGSVPASGDN